MKGKRYTHIRKGRKAVAKHRGQQPPRPPSPLASFTALEWGEIKGQPVAWVPCDRPRPRDGSDLVGTIVIVDGTRYRCREVHVTMRMSTRLKEDLKLPLRKGEKIGLVLAGVN